MRNNDVWEARDVLVGIHYKPGWALQWNYSMMHVHIRWQFRAPDYTRGGEALHTWHSRWWDLSTVGLTEDAIVKTALAAALQAEEHECREAFTYKGVRLFDPHLTVQKLMEAACPST